MRSRKIQLEIELGQRCESQLMGMLASGGSSIRDWHSVMFLRRS